MQIPQGFRNLLTVADFPSPSARTKSSPLFFLFRPSETTSVAEFSNENDMSPEEDMRSPQERKSPRGQAGVTENGGIDETLFSSEFRSVAVMAGWDEEALLIASLIVDDTPDRQFKHMKRTEAGFKTPPSNSRCGKRRRDQRRSLAPIPATVLDLGEDQQENKPDSHDMKETTGASNKEVAEENKGVAGSKVTSSASTMHGQGLPLPSLDRLREELSCAICLEICFEPSTTACGHSFCRKCLKSAADKCGKRGPKCRQLISNGRSCSVNTVLWNTIQLLFPDEVESRKAAKAEKIKASEESEFHSPNLAGSNSTRRRSLRAAAVISRELYERRRAMPSIQEAPEFHVPESGETNNYRRRSLRSAAVSNRDLHERRRRPLPSQDEDAALALRLQREEFMDAFRETRENYRTSTSLSMARANLRALASRAINIRVRNHAI